MIGSRAPDDPPLSRCVVFSIRLSLENDVLGEQYHQRWFALEVKPKAEETVAAILSQKGYESYLTKKRVSADAVGIVRKPLFPGYVFCRYDTGVKSPILLTPGVIKILGFGRTPEPIDDNAIRIVYSMETSNLPLESCQFISCGDEVEMIAGPLRGTRGILLTDPTASRLVASLLLLQRSISVVIEPSWAKPVKLANRSARGDGGGWAKGAVATSVL